jgi:hypothetical protein
MERYVVIITGDDFKCAEILAHFQRYGIKLIQHKDNKMSFEAVYNHFTSTVSNPKFKLLAVFQESTLLLTRNTLKRASIKHMELVTHRSTLMGLITIDGQPMHYHDVCDTNGYIDMNRRVDTIQLGIFGWDDIFVVNTYHQSYHQLALLGLKLSSRNVVISRYIEKHIHYANWIQMKYHKVKFDRPMEFDMTDIKGILYTLVKNNPVLKSYKFHNLFTTVFNNGIMLRAPHTRVTKLFWFALLNAGIPMTRKEKDPIQELIYTIHDFAHHTDPDLIFNGVNPDAATAKFNEKLYVLHRLASEAYTLPMADGLGVDGLIRSGTEYKTVNDRCIYPLFQDLQLNLIMPNDFKKIIKASVQYTLTGDYSLFQLLLEGKPQENFAIFLNKFEHFFTADHEWTRQNYSAMVSHSEQFREWWAYVSCINDKFGLGLNTIDQFRESLDSSVPLWEGIYEQIMERYISPIFADDDVEELPVDVQLTKSLARYAMGQMFIFFRYSHIPFGSVYRDMIRDYLMDANKTVFNMEDIKTVRAFYDEFISMCETTHCITSDDAVNYREVFPLVEPYIVSYEKSDKTLKSMYADLMHDQ